jgi:hypothetical protein
MSGDISYQQVHKTAVSPRELCAIIPQSVNDAILCALSKNPDERQPNARVLKAELTQILDDLGGCAKYGMQNQTQIADPPARSPAAAEPPSGLALEELDSELDLH